MSKHYLRDLVLLALAMILSGCAPTLMGGPDGVYPGITTSLTVNDVEVQVRTVELTDSYSSGFRGGTSVTVRTSDEAVMVVTAELLAQGDVLDVLDWPVTLTADGGDPLEAATATITTSAERKGARITWVFTVAAEGQTFVLNLPDGQTIDLSRWVWRPSDAEK